MSRLHHESAQPFDARRVRALIEAWARHEAWFQLGSPDFDTYEWPVPGTREIANEGKAAYMAYRDFLASVVLGFDGHGPLLDDLQHLASAVELRTPGAVSRLLKAADASASQFHQQWTNLFSRDQVWAGLSHDTLGAYVRRYEVEQPLRLLVWFRDLYETETYDESLRRFRDQQGRLRKGKMVEHVIAGFKEFPHLQRLLEHGYSIRLRNLIGHNEYQIDGDLLRSLDGQWSCTERELFARFQAVGAVHNALLWMGSTVRAPSDLASRGVVGVAWALAETRPSLRVLQLAPFGKFDPAAEWASSVSITVGSDSVVTAVSDSRERMGPLVPLLRPVLAAIARSGVVACEVVRVVPCLHLDEYEHQTYQLGPHRFCEFSVVERGEVAATINGLNSVD